MEVSVQISQQSKDLCLGVRRSSRHLSLVGSDHLFSFNWSPLGRTINAGWESIPQSYLVPLSEVGYHFRCVCAFPEQES